MSEIPHGVDNRAERERLIAEVMQRTGVRLSPEDPAFAIIELARLSFEQTISATHSRLEPMAIAIDGAARKAATDVMRSTLGAISVETLAARDAIRSEQHAAADELRATAATIQKDSAQALARLIDVERRGARYKYLALGIVAATALSVAMFCAGATTRLLVESPAHRSINP